MHMYIQSKYIYLERDREVIQINITELYNSDLQFPQFQSRTSSGRKKTEEPLVQCKWNNIK